MHLSAASKSLLVIGVAALGVLPVQLHANAVVATNSATAKLPSIPQQSHHLRGQATAAGNTAVATEPMVTLAVTSLCDEITVIHLTSLLKSHGVPLVVCVAGYGRLTWRIDQSNERRVHDLVRKDAARRGYPIWFPDEPRMRPDTAGKWEMVEIDRDYKELPGIADLFSKPIRMVLQHRALADACHRWPKLRSIRYRRREYLDGRTLRAGYEVKVDVAATLSANEPSTFVVQFQTFYPNRVVTPD